MTNFCFERGWRAGAVPLQPATIPECCVVKTNSNGNKASTQQSDLAKLPRALAPLIERPQWAVWRWTQKSDGSWQKPPFMALQPERHASTSDPSTWTDYSTALAAVQAGQADGLSYILTKDDPFGAIDLDHCRCTITNSIDVWAQNYLQAAINTWEPRTILAFGSGCSARAEVSPRSRDRFDAWPASARSFARCHTESTRERTQAGAAAIRSS